MLVCDKCRGGMSSEIGKVTINMTFLDHASEIVSSPGGEMELCAECCECLENEINAIVAKYQIR